MEVLLSIGLVSIAFAGIFAGLAATVKMSGDNSQRVAAAEALSAVTESLREMPYQPCRTPTELTADYAAFAAGHHPANFTVTITDVSYTTTGTNTFVAACPSGNVPKRVTVSVVAAGDASVQASGQVVLSDPAARPAP